MIPEPTPADERIMRAMEIEEQVCLGYSTRAACLELGIPPSTGRRWLRELEEMRIEEQLRHPPTRRRSDPDDIPF